MPGEEFIYTNRLYHQASVSGKKFARNILLSLLMQEENFFGTVSRLLASSEPDATVKITLGINIIDIFRSLGVSKPDVNLVIDISDDFLNIIKKRPRYKQEYDSLSNTEKGRLRANTIKELFKEPSLQTYLRSCQVAMLNQTEDMQNIIIEKHLKQRLLLLKISYPALRHDQEFEEDVRDILTKSIKYNYSLKSIIRLQKYDLIARAFAINENMPLESCRPIAVMTNLLEYEKKFFQDEFFEVADAFEKFQSGMAEAIKFAEELDKKLIKPELPVKSILTVISLASAGTLWMGIGGIPIFMFNSILWGAGGYYDYAYNKPQFRKEIISWREIKATSEKFIEAMKFKKVLSNKPHEIVYSNLLPSPELETTLNKLLSNLAGIQLESSHAYLARELGKQPPGTKNKEEKKAEEIKLPKPIVSVEKKLTTWLNGIIRSDNIKEIKEGNLPGGATGYFWIAWDSFFKTYSSEFREKLEDHLSRNVPNTFCPLKDLTSIRTVKFVDEDKDQRKIILIIEEPNETFDNEIKCDKKGFSSFMLKADQPDGKSLRVVGIEISHLITPEAKKSFATTTKNVVIKLSPTMINAYKKLQKEAKEEEEIKYSSLQL